MVAGIQDPSKLNATSRRGLIQARSGKIRCPSFTVIGSLNFQGACKSFFPVAASLALACYLAVCTTSGHRALASDGPERSLCPCCRVHVYVVKYCPWLVKVLRPWSVVSLARVVF